MWYYIKDNQQQGPIQGQILQEMINSGLLTPETLVCSKSINKWVPAKDIPTQQFLETPDVSTSRPAQNVTASYRSDRDISQPKSRKWLNWKTLAVVFFLIMLGQYMAYTTYTSYRKFSSEAPHRVMIAIRDEDVSAVEKWLSVSPSIDWMYTDPNPKIKDATGFGDTFLTEAVSQVHPHPEIVKLIIKRGADVNKRNVKGESPLALAKRYLDKESLSPGNLWKPERQEIVDILIQVGAKE